MSAEITRVLHVDDDPNFSDVVTSFLESEDEALEVVTETSVEDGLSQLQKGSVDCVVSDYDMPETNGLDFFEAVRESHPEMPFILFTGKGSEEIASTAISRGVTDYLQKAGGTEQYEVLANRIRNSVDRHRTERELRRNREFLTRVLNLNPSAIIVLDECGEIVRANERAETILDLPESEITSRSFDDAEWDVVDEDGCSISKDALPFGRVRESGESVYEIQHGIRRADGDVVWVSINAAPLWDEHDEIQYVVTVVSDITSRKRKNQSLNATIIQLEGFGNVLSHDLGNIHQIAHGRLELARDTGEQEHFEAVEESIDRAEGMLDELTTAMQAGSIVEEVATVAVDDVFDRAWQSQATADATREVEEGIRIEANEMALQRMFENLVRNAFEHGDNTATVRVGSLADGFYVEDDGPGIPKDERENVFEPGYTTKKGGTGTGLVSIQQIALAHGWDTEIRDGSDGGARFNFTTSNRAADR
ncbi:response regulator [Halostagnicola kamekurae]|uniref:histidine kinase n=1 Tax=Halostagnicola kamekurae TaxID=619731 RepID=A0A1I6UAB1_9EURY|nr:response regulator [Halostagnicola kamekurae]SFS98308.1 PAS domain S-box-containing protein [Halostagnicola kamekurae]